MSNRIGSSTIYSSILPRANKLHSVKLSREARHRLRIVEYYLKADNVSLACRHFGISRSYFYKWFGRYNPRDLSSLEDRSRKPKRTRTATYDNDLVALIRKLRQDYPRFSAKKLAVILARDFGIRYSAATIGRIIKRFGLYFSAVIRASKRSRAAIKAWVKRKPYHLKATGPRQVIEFDMKHIWLLGRKYYAFVAIDIFSKEACIHVAGRPSSYQATLALEQILARFGTDICIVNDNGSENFGRAYAYLQDQDITQYFARPKTPKDKPHVENLIGKLQQECLDEHRTATTVEKLRIQINHWLNDYHFFRPHQSLNYLTPDEFCATLNITIPRVRVSTM